MRCCPPGLPAPGSCCAAAACCWRCWWKAEGSTLAQLSTRCSTCAHMAASSALILCTAQTPAQSLHADPFDPSMLPLPGPQPRLIEASGRLHRDTLKEALHFQMHAAEAGRRSVCLLGGGDAVGQRERDAGRGGGRRALPRVRLHRDARDELRERGPARVGARQRLHAWPRQQQAPARHHTGAIL